MHGLQRCQGHLLSMQVVHLGRIHGHAVLLRVLRRRRRLLLLEGQHLFAQQPGRLSESDFVMSCARQSCFAAAHPLHARAAAHSGSKCVQTVTR